MTLGVMAGLVPAIHACRGAKAWIPGPTPGMTELRLAVVV
jgi:hypothetical protein